MTKRLATLLLTSLPLQIVVADDLMDIYRLAVQNDPEFKISDINQSTARESRSQSIAQMLPNLSFTAQSSQVRANSTKQGFNQAGFGLLQHFWDNTLGVNLTQPVFHWDHWVQLSQSDNQIAQAEADFQAKQQALMTRTAEAYFNVLADQDNLEFLNAEKQSIE